MSKTVSLPIWQDGPHTYIRLHIIPSASIDLIRICTNSSLEVSVKAKAESGKANARLISFLSKQLGIPVNSIAIRQGHSSRKKLIVIKDTDATLILRAIGF
jgi:uncharacterized protein